mmetsp:Transcript_3611/g.7984  ORF Transcript_3611/g.7984 Transcript_3611/m.7984 type:complete len:161 (+) Transcript_3611:2497-2979(+)
MKQQTNGGGTTRTKKEVSAVAPSSSSSPNTERPPPTPCTRICRYNQKCFDGKVCIGCFRETHEIARWSSMSPNEKRCSLEDAADRFCDLAVAASSSTSSSANDSDYDSDYDHDTANDNDDATAGGTTTADSSSLLQHFGGGISEAELRRQALLWGAREEP